MRLVDLFSGSGGLVSGAISAGFDVVGSFEKWGIAVETLRDNFAHPVYKLDLGDVDRALEEINFLRPDIIVGGPPCQDFSTAGNGIEGQRANLTVSFSRIVARSSAQTFVMENVPSVRNSGAFAKAEREFQLAGFSLVSIVVNASLFGVPQNRRRFFLVGVREKDAKGIQRAVESFEDVFPTTVRKYWPDVPFDHFYRHPRTYQRRGVFSVDEPSPTIRGINRPKPPNYVSHRSDTSDSPDIRALTTTERAKLQTFRPAFRWSGSKTQVDQMIGNAVPPLLAHKIFSALQAWLSGKSAKANFIKWLIEDQQTTPNRAKSTLRVLRKTHRDAPFDLQVALVSGELTNASTDKVYGREVEEAIEFYRQYLRQR